MKAYGQTTDMRSGFLRELGGRGATLPSRMVVDTIGWESADQVVEQFKHTIVSKPARFTAASIDPIRPVDRPVDR